MPYMSSEGPSVVDRTLIVRLLEASGPRDKETKDAFYGFTSRYFEQLVDPAWLELKNLGNREFRAGRYESAKRAYRDAAQVATSPRRGLDTLVDSLQRTGAPVDSARRITTVVARYLHPPVEWRRRRRGKLEVVPAPNRPAAVCLANRAAVLIKQKRFAEALDNARAAVELCPDYTKGHYREMRCHELMGRADDERAARERMAECKRFAGMYVDQSMVLFRLGWVEGAHLAPYAAVRFHACLEHIRRESKAFNANYGRVVVPPVSAQVSLVRLGDAQCLRCNLTFTRPLEKDASPGRSAQQQLSNVWFRVLDQKRGAMLDKPPHGTPSPRSQALAPLLAADFLKRVIAEGLAVVAVAIGQGLVELAEEVEKAVSAAIPDRYSRPMVQVAYATRHGPTYGGPDRPHRRPKITNGKMDRHSARRDRRARAAAARARGGARFRVSSEAKSSR